MKKRKKKKKDKEKNPQTKKVNGRNEKMTNENDKKQGPAGQRCVHGHIKHMKHMYEAHV